MQSGYWSIICILVTTLLLSDVALAASSAGTNPGFSSLPTTFEWEGDKVLNGESTTSLFEESSLGDTLSEGMVMYSTSGLSNDTMATNHFGNNTTNSTKIGSKPNNALSGYASVGDIIRAHDWAALERYTSSINATTEIADSSVSLENRNSNWNKLFQDPQPIIACGPC